MGNLIALCTAGEIQSRETGWLKDHKVVQIMRIDDGKILEFRNPVLVKDVLANYPNSYVGFFNGATQPLPLHYKLKIGKIYYLFPCPDDHDHDHDDHEKVDPRKVGGSEGGDHRREGTKRRIKVVITKEQLQQLLAKPNGFQEALLLGARGSGLGFEEDDHGFGSSSTWLPKLETIHEGSDFIC